MALVTKEEERCGQYPDNGKIYIAFSPNVAIVPSTMSYMDNGKVFWCVPFGILFSGHIKSINGIPWEHIKPYNGVDQSHIKTALGIEG